MRLQRSIALLIVVWSLLLAACQSNPPQSDPQPLAIRTPNNAVDVTVGEEDTTLSKVSAAGATLAKNRQAAPQKASQHRVSGLSAEEAFAEAKALHGQARYPEMIQQLEHAAQAGHAPAQLVLADAYLNLSDYRDERRARHWYQKAAHQGVPDAAFQLGVMLDAGVGGPKDPKQAGNWVGQAARDGYPPAQFQVAQALLQEQDRAHHQEAFRLMKNAAAQRYPQAVYVLGRMYLHGVGVTKDVAKSLPLLKSVAESGNVDAQFEYGLALYSLQPRTVEAVTDSATWFQKSAEKGHPKARAYLAKVHAYMNTPKVQQQSF